MVEQKEKDTPRIKELKYKSRVNSIKAGIFGSAKSSFGDYFLSPFAIAINASNSLVAMFTAISGILGPLSQIFGSRLMDKIPRKKIVVRSVFFELLVWIPFIAIALLFWFKVVTNILPLMFMLFFAYYIISSNIGNPAWFSWTGDIINERYRGKWFSKRNLIMGFVSAVLALAASFLLDYFKNANLMIFGFVILFTLAFIARVISWEFYKKQYEPKLEFEDGYYFSFFSFVMKASKTNFGRFSFFSALFNFATAISTPLFAIYMLRYLNFNYITYIIITVAGTIFSLIVMELWGKIADRFGNYVVLYITSILTAAVPILWIFSPSPIYLIFVPTLVGGLSASGLSLATSDFIYDNVRVEKRGLVVSYFNMLNGIGIFLGAGIGALLIQFLTIGFLNPIFFIFLLSGAIGIISVFLLMPKVIEVRNVKKDRFRNVIFKQLKPVILCEFHEIMSIKRYLKK